MLHHDGRLRHGWVHIGREDSVHLENVTILRFYLMSLEGEAMGLHDVLDGLRLLLALVSEVLALFNPDLLWVLLEQAIEELVNSIEVLLDVVKHGDEVNLVALVGELALDTSLQLLPVVLAQSVEDGWLLFEALLERQKVILNQWHLFLE